MTIRASFWADFGAIFLAKKTYWTAALDLLRGVVDEAHGPVHVGLSGAEPDVSKDDVDQGQRSGPLFYVDGTGVSVGPHLRVYHLPDGICFSGGLEILWLNPEVVIQ